MVSTVLKRLFVSNHFKGDAVPEILKKTFRISDKNIWFNWSFLVGLRYIVVLGSITVHLSVYLLRGADYIGCTKWDLSKHIYEHHTTWLSKGLQKSSKSSTVNSDHSTSTKASFQLYIQSEKLMDNAFYLTTLDNITSFYYLI